MDGAPGTEGGGHGDGDGAWVVLAHGLLNSMSVVLSNLRSIADDRDGDERRAPNEGLVPLTIALHEAETVTSLLGQAVRGVVPIDVDRLRPPLRSAELPGAYVRLLANGDFRSECPRCGWASMATSDLAHAGRIAAAHRRGDCVVAIDGADRRVVDLRTSHTRRSPD